MTDDGYTIYSNGGTDLPAPNQSAVEDREVLENVGRYAVLGNRGGPDENEEG